MKKMVTSKQLDANHTSASITRAPRVEMGLDPAHLEVTGNPVTTSQTADVFPILVSGPKVILMHLLYFHALYIWVNSYCLINVDAHEARQWPGKGEHAESDEALKGCTIEKVEDYLEEWSSFP